MSRLILKAQQSSKGNSAALTPTSTIPTFNTRYLRNDWCAVLKYLIHHELNILHSKSNVKSFYYNTERNLFIYSLDSNHLPLSSIALCCIIILLYSSGSQSLSNIVSNASTLIVSGTVAKQLS